MAKSQAELESMIPDVTKGAVDTFVKDIATMFDTEASANELDVATGTVGELKERYKKLAAVCSVKTEGALNGQFHVVFDREGLFTLTGTFVMQPEQVIKENRKECTEEKAKEFGDALSEVGNVVVEAWDRHFAEKIHNHGHCVQSGTFIGEPWSGCEKKIGLASKEELLIVNFEMTVAPLEPFMCSVIYPKSIFEPLVEEAVEDGGATGKTGSTMEAVAEDSEGEAESVEADSDAKESAGDEESIAQDDGLEDTAGESETQDEAAQAGGQEGQPVSEAIHKMTQSAAALPGEGANKGDILTAITAGDVVKKEVVWAGMEDTVEQLAAKMQQHNTGYLLIGKDGILEGIVGKSDIRGALSPYLQTALVKWRGPMDIATLQIKAQWVMNRSVHTVKADATLRAVTQAMSEHGVGCMPVVDAEGKVHGTITVFDVFGALLTGSSDVSNAGVTCELPPVTL